MSLTTKTVTEEVTHAITTVICDICNEPIPLENRWISYVVPDGVDCHKDCVTKLIQSALDNKGEK